MNNEIKSTPCQNHDKEVIEKQVDRLELIKEHYIAGEAEKQDVENKDSISITMDSLKSLLQYKNSRYGNSATNPIKIFSKEDSKNGLLLRIDDKISRVMNSSDIRKNDVSDLIGYLTLLCINQGWYNFDEFKD